MSVVSTNELMQDAFKRRYGIAASRVFLSLGEVPIQHCFVNCLVVNSKI